MLVELSYIEQTPPQSMHVWMNLNFIAYIANQCCWWSFHYIYSTMQSARQMLKNKTKAWSPIPFKPSKLLPHWQPLPKWADRLRRPIVRVPPQCVHDPKRVKTHAQIQRQNFGGNQTILRIKDCKQNMMTRWLSFQQMKIAIKKSK
jgi:hypothetical protein